MGSTFKFFDNTTLLMVTGQCLFDILIQYAKTVSLRFNLNCKILPKGTRVYTDFPFSLFEMKLSKRRSGREDLNFIPTYSECCQGNGWHSVFLFTILTDLTLPET